MVVCLSSYLIQSHIYVICYIDVIMVMQQRSLFKYLGIALAFLGDIVGTHLQNHGPWD
jgi:hypothetical protein